MKKMLLLSLLAIFGWINSSGQAFHDVDLISKLKVTDSTDLEKIADILIPYFTSDGVVQTDRMKKYLQGGLGDKMVSYLERKATDLTLIQQFAMTSKTALTDLITGIRKDLSLLNAIKSKFGNIIPGLPPSFKLEDISDRYVNKEFEEKLRRYIILVKSNGLQDSSRFHQETIKLDSILNLSGTDQAQEVLDSLSSITMLVSRIHDDKARVYKSIRENKLLDDLLKFKTSVNGSVAITKGINASFKLSSLKSFAVFQQSSAPAVSQQLMSMSSFRMPSQSEMIDALVIFIAKRFSQEITMTFLESLKQRAKTMELVSDLFPATVKLLSEGNSYEVPRLGSAWHYAIAQDINNIPLHLKDSKYIRSIIANSKFSGYFPLFQDIVTMAEMAKSGNSLPEIINMYKGGLCTFNDQNFLFAFEVMTMIDNEFLDTDSQSAYWLKWDRLANLTDANWDLMIKMIASKYKTKLFDGKGFAFTDRNFDDPRWLSFRKTIQRALLVLNQFEEKRKALSSVASAASGMQVKQFSFWDCQQQLFNVMLDPNLVTDVKMRSALLFLDKGMLIYKLQEEGSHAAMIRESIQLVQDLFPKETGRISDLFVKNWRLAKEKYEPQWQQLKPQLIALDQMYQEISTLNDSVAKKEFILKKFEDNPHFGLKPSQSYLQMKTQLSTKMMELLRKGDQARLLAIKSDQAIMRLLDSADKKHLNTLLYVEGKSQSSLTTVLKTAEFFTDVMGASNSAQLAEVIKAYAMPPNSYKVRRSSRNSIDLDVHLGIYGGAEWIGSEKLELGVSAKVYRRSAIKRTPLSGLN